METKAVFERKVALTPRDLNKVAKKASIDDIILEKLSADIEGKCSQHGWVIPGSTKILSRSMCQSESGRFTGAMVSWVQFEASVYYPIDGMEIQGEVLKKNKMGMFVVYKDAIQVMVPRDLHLGDEAYDEVEVNDSVRVEIKKSRFQVNDPYILSVGVFKGYADETFDGTPAVERMPPVESELAGAIPEETEEETAEQEVGEEITAPNIGETEVGSVPVPVPAPQIPGMELDLGIAE